jgi:4-amino-4-deoxy-L-arabinose transferase-like glycosyltransferase
MSENERKYKESFGFDSANSKVKEALEHALDIRKFEIGLYWKRAAYFWTLIAVTFAGYFAILSADPGNLRDKEFLSFVIACIGLVFTWAWFLVNRGSKYWQENWENHVDELEDNVIGPLYKTILHRPPQVDFVEKWFIGPSPISVSKINQWVSFFTLLIWIILIFYSFFHPFFLSYTLWIKKLGVGLTTLFFCTIMTLKGKTHTGPQRHSMLKRETKII